jgi:uncharacterized protein YcnI
MRFQTTLFATLVVSLLAAPVAGAHVTANPSSAEAGGFAMIAFRVPHGCEESPTTSLTIRIPDGVVSVAPQAVPGWTVTTVSGKLSKPVDLHGEQVTEGVKTVTWSGGRLDPHQFSDFGISMRLPEAAGETIYFPAVQRCAQGVSRWIQLPAAGGEEPELPAPGVELVAASGAATTTGHTPAAGEDGEEAAAASSGSEPDDDRANLALAFGIAGLLAGLAGLGFGLRRRAAA